MNGEPAIIALGPCARCDVPFTFDPDTVPSIWCDPVTRLPKEPDDPTPPRAERLALCPECAALVAAIAGTGQVVTWFPGRAD